MALKAVPTRWDGVRAKKRNESEGRDPRTCLWCRKDATPRFMYCTDACSNASRDELADNLVFACQPCNVSRGSRLGPPPRLTKGNT